MILYILLLFVGLSFSQYEWDNSVLQTKPWPVENCEIVNSSNPITERPPECNNTCNAERCTITAAVILPDNETYIVNVEAGRQILQDAQDHVFRQHILDPNRVQFELHFFDDKCKQEYATVGVIYYSCAHVMFGPVCDYSLAGVGRSAKYIGRRGIPIISPGGLADAFTEEKRGYSNEFYMVINASPLNSRSFGEFFHLIADRYKWRNFVFMYEPQMRQDVGGEDSCKFVVQGLIDELKTINQLNYQDGDLDLLGKNYTKFLKTVVGVKYSLILMCNNQENVRQIALEAYDLNMMESGEYIFFNFEAYTRATVQGEPWFDPNDLENNEKAKKAFRSIYTFTPIEEAKFENKTQEGSSFLDGLFDGMLLFANALNKSIDEQQGGETIHLYGENITKHMMGSSFRGKTDEVKINCNGQRVATYALMNLNSNNKYEVVAEYTDLNKTITKWNVQWLKATPADTPVCGYDQSLCPKYNMVLILIISLIIVLCLGILIVCIILYRHYKLKKAIYSMVWKVFYDDILFFPMKARSSFQSTASLRRGSQLTYLEVDGVSMAGDRQVYTTVGFYKSTKVAVKYLQDIKIELTKEELVELKTMKDISFDNLVKFHGASVDIPNCILSEYCPKGSLQDILENENVQLDHTFKMSLIMDIVRGMVYLHNSAVKSHGALKSTNCLVDSRFVLKIADFGLHFLRKFSKEIDDDQDAHSNFEKLLWTAPELLRMLHPPPGGTQKADVYSFAIIMHEIIVRQGVFHLGDEFMNIKDTPIKSKKA